MDTIISIFINREGYTREEAREEFLEMRKEAQEIIKEGGNLTQIEDLLLDQGIDLDHILELI